MNRTRVETLGRAAADVSAAALAVLNANNKLRYAEQQVIADVWPEAAMTSAQKGLDDAEGQLRGLVEVLKLQIGELE
jgi:hypothetical protein